MQGWRGSVPTLLLLLGFAAVDLAAEAPVAVSPGDASRIALIEGRCPTFSWGEVEGARNYEIVVYRLTDEGEQAQRILRQTFEGSVESWTPSLDLCLERGGRYAWSVRASGAKKPSEWSAPNMFEVAAGLSDAGVEAAVRSYLEERRSAAGTVASGRLQPTPRSAGSAPGPVAGAPVQQGTAPGVTQRGSSDAADEPDLVVAGDSGDVGVLASDPTAEDSDLVLATNDDLAIVLDTDAASSPGGGAQFEIWSGRPEAGGVLLFTVSQAGIQTDAAVQMAVCQLLAESALLPVPAFCKRTFRTSAGYQGDLVASATACCGYTGSDGLEAGDAICNFHAQAAGFTGTFTAWLSDDAVEGKDRLSASIPWFRPDGLLVETSLAALLDCPADCLANPILLDETGADLMSALVWTGTGPNGERAGQRCDEWTSVGAEGQIGVVGLSSAVDGDWTADTIASCSMLLPLYCLED